MGARLCELIAGAEITKTHLNTDIFITDVTNDSRRVTKGCLFTAERGTRTDGHRFIREALQKGAAAVVSEEPPGEDVPYILTNDARRTFSVLCANLFERPVERLTMIGVTGTNGKTTVTNLVKQLLERTRGWKTGLIGTNRNMIGDEELPAQRTTPDARELQELLSRMAAADCRAAIMEVSSHALALDRGWGIPFGVGVFTNLTEDHLDFHGTMDNYFAAKSRLMEMSETCIVGLDDPYGERMLAAAKLKRLTFALDRPADLTARDVRLLPEGVAFTLCVNGGLYKTELPIPGRFSVYNALAAIGTVIALGVEPEKAAWALPFCTGVKGRAEVVETGRDFTVLIDYAHTPDALENILDTVRGFTKGKLILLFGCGGDRERGKRPLMGRIASEKADIVFITSDNPRTEDPEAIIREIVAGVPGDKRSRCRTVISRREAIAAALEAAGKDDVVLLAGKGHETYQTVGTETRPFDERRVVRELLGSDLV